MGDYGLWGEENGMGHDFGMKLFFDLIGPYEGSHHFLDLFTTLNPIPWNINDHVKRITYI